MDHSGYGTLVHLRTHFSERVRPQVEMCFDTRRRGAKANLGGCIRLVGPTTRSGCIGSVLSGGDPIAFTGSIDRYRAARASGRVHTAGTATIRGRPAVWLRVTPPRRSAGFRVRSVDYVAVDETTGAPFRIESRQGTKVLRGTDIQAVEQQTALPGRGAREITLDRAAVLLPGALWAGRTVAGQPLTRVRAIDLDDGKTQIELLYGGPCPARCIVVKQGVEAGWAPDSRLYAALPDQTVSCSGAATATAARARSCCASRHEQGCDARNGPRVAPGPALSDCLDTLSSILE